VIYGAVGSYPDDTRASKFQVLFDAPAKNYQRGRRPAARKKFRAEIVENWKARLDSQSSTGTKSASVY